jgi:S-adenosylmethionine hydrolase
VIGADRFGNLLTSVTEQDLAALSGPRALVVEIGGVRVGSPVTAYAEARPGDMGAVVSSTGRLEVFVRDGSAQATLGLGRGAPVVVKRG